MGVIQKQGLLNTVITYSGVVIGFVSLLFIQPQLLTSSELGLVRILLAFSTIVATVMPLGVGNINTKFFPHFRNKDKKHYGYFGFMLLFLIAGFIICTALIFLFKSNIIELYSEQSPLFVNYFYLAIPFAFIIACVAILNTYVSSLYKTVAVTFWDSIMNKLLFVVVIVLYYLEILSFDLFVFSFIGLYVIQVLFLLIYALVTDSVSLRINFPKIKSVGVKPMIKYGLLLSLASISSSGLRLIDTVMIGAFLELDFVGIFAVTSFIALIIEIPLTSLEKISNVQIARFWVENNIEGIKNIYKKSVRYLMLIGGILLIGILLNIQDMLSFLPQQYADAKNVTIIASIGAFINISTGLNNAVLFNSNKYIYGTYLLLLLLVLAVINNLIFIPLLGIEGAAFASALSSVIYNIIKFIIIKIKFKMQPYDLSALKILLIISVTYFIGCLIPSFEFTVLSMVFRSVIVSFLYVSLVYLFRIAPEFDHYFKLKFK